MDKQFKPKVKIKAPVKFSVKARPKAPTKVEDSNANIDWWASKFAWLWKFIDWIRYRGKK